MKITPLSKHLIGPVHHLMTLGEPFIFARTTSDYWAYGELFASTCPVALIDDEVVGAVMAFRSQVEPNEIYIQDVMVHPGHRNHGVASALLGSIRDQAATWGCTRLYLTSEPQNTAAQATWRKLGFVNVPGDYEVDEVSITKDFKGMGKDRAVFEVRLHSR
ncbi:hypothetical protein Lfu02_49480 [Longispora fulva]|uniref:GNAT superfamily N-acetyltransferase n=1 Tax=Longispora fulva TaxID=619741 RepID=A0A8J7GKH2_9ACTN|nr:GNAT family N-acetyltransferase [Longispora fulva]MBG6138323.1 GNAT superfamily N-acetyltransferase [Longispora fulva]GIG60576.1 hypothetical protein Lfu02_49480 [Longispora fulva]